MRISSNFDSGNIEVIEAADPADIRLAIRKDKDSDFYQWFHFRLTGAKGTPCTLRIVNAGGAAYPGGWPGYRARASYDRETWFQVPTEYRDGVLSITLTPERDSVHFAYFAPYSMERHHDLIARCQLSPLVRLEVAGTTLDGQDIDLLQVGTPGAGKKRCWVIARQHPGETMAEWWMEGFLERLLDPADPVARAVLDRAVLYVVPNMNPDGSRRGHLRTNAAGANLNREWLEPTAERSPEVLHVRAAMAERGIDFCLDVHGDEAIPANFLANCFGIPSLTPKQKALHHDFSDALLKASPDFQDKLGYEENPPGKANLTMCTNYLAETHGCLAMTLEMPFKDNDGLPDPAHGWSPARCKLFGRANLDALLQVVEGL
ncbi:MAG TPA: M14-type cytosolic carboxypeptidase [Azospirillaceae bacterium]|nr:M14-type cytosolic carboxypeptidase [Azospirillaceae bacterium]